MQIITSRVMVGRQAAPLRRGARCGGLYQSSCSRAGPAALRPSAVQPFRRRVIVAAHDENEEPEREYDEDGLWIGANQLTLALRHGLPTNTSEQISTLTLFSWPRTTGTYSTFWTDPAQLKGVAIFCAVLASFFSLGNLGAAIVLPLLYNKPIELCAPAILLGYPC